MKPHLKRSELNFLGGLSGSINYSSAFGKSLNVSFQSGAGSSLDFEPVNECRNEINLTRNEEIKVFSIIGKDGGVLNKLVPSNVQCSNIK